MFKKGFTLIEVLMVIVIIGILATTILAFLSGTAVKRKAHDAKEIAHLKQLEIAIASYYEDHKEYPRMEHVTGCPNSGFGYCIDWMYSHPNTAFIDSLQNERYLDAEWTCRMFGVECSEGGSDLEVIDQDLRDAVYLTTTDRRTAFKVMARLYDNDKNLNDGGTMDCYYELGNGLTSITPPNAFGYEWDSYCP